MIILMKKDWTRLIEAAKLKYDFSDCNDLSNLYEIPGSELQAVNTPM